MKPKGVGEKYTEFEKTFYALDIEEDDEDYTELDKIVYANFMVQKIRMGNLS